MAKRRNAKQPPRRAKPSQKEWLAGKRAYLPDAGQDGASPENDATDARTVGRAEIDFREYYEAQHLFGTDSPEEAVAQYEALWRIMRSPLPATVRVSRRCCPLLAARTEKRLASMGWTRRREFDKAGQSVWEIEDERYADVREWTEVQNRWGAISFQELVSMLPAMLLAPRPEHICLDVCAAPGNKSSQLLEALERGSTVATPTAIGAVLSSDANPQRCCLALQRVLTKAACPASCSALVNAKEYPTLVDPRDKNKLLEYSRILADVPCSGDGTVRKNAQVWRSWSRKEALELHSLQRNILVRALHLLPPGGILVYSTCSLNPIENEAVVLCAMRKWHQRLDGGIELMDTLSACREVCDLIPSPGLTRWVVPAPGRGGLIFSSDVEVPEKLRHVVGGLIRPEMFPCREGSDIDKELVPQLRRCARFYPHHNNTGGFFMAMIRKVAPISSVPPQMPRASMESRGTRDHSMMIMEYTRVQACDPDWLQISSFFSIDSSWAEEKLRGGLLFWRAINGKQPEGLYLASEGTARLFDARVASGRVLSWVKVGAAIFEKLPKGFLTGSIAPTRWRIAAEGAAIVEQAVRRRKVKLRPEEMLKLLQSENRQVCIEELRCSIMDCQPLKDSGHECGGVLVNVAGWEFEHLCVPGALTPRLLRLLADKDAIDALAELLSETMSRSCLENDVVSPQPRVAFADCLRFCWKGFSIFAQHVVQSARLQK